MPLSLDPAADANHARNVAAKIRETHTRRRSEVLNFCKQRYASIAELLGSDEFPKEIAQKLAGESVASRKRFGDIALKEIRPLLDDMRQAVARVQTIADMARNPKAFIAVRTVGDPRLDRYMSSVRGAGVPALNTLAKAAIASRDEFLAACIIQELEARPASDREFAERSGRLTAPDGSTVAFTTAALAEIVAGPKQREVLAIAANVGEVAKDAEQAFSETVHLATHGVDRGVSVFSAGVDPKVHVSDNATLTADEKIRRGLEARNESKRRDAITRDRAQTQTADQNAAAIREGNPAGVDYFTAPAT